MNLNSIQEAKDRLKNRIKVYKYNYSFDENVQNFPAFEAYLSANTDISNTTDTKVNCNTEVFDTDSAYDNSSNYRFTVPTKNPEHVETVIKIISDISHKLTLEPEAFGRERKIVEEEWRKQYGNNKRF